MYDLNEHGGHLFDIILYVDTSCTYYIQNQITLCMSVVVYMVCCEIIIAMLYLK